MNSRTRVSVTLLVCSAAALISATGLLSTRANETPLTKFQDVAPTQPQTKKPKKRVLPPYGFSETTPPGTWAAIADFDISQTRDPDIPVIIVGLSSYAGKGLWAKQIMVDEVTIRNRSATSIDSVRLGWIIIRDEDRRAGKNRRAALRDGFTPRLAVEMLPDREFGKIPDLNLDFVKEARDLIKSGTLTGVTFIRLRVAEVRFADGSVWKESDAVAKRMHHPALPILNVNH
ncbi:MAG TPA: hypothetical protein VLA93_03410 [Pyrinomonadaceae bacterium]|nr:hypothetical protein [Pyrinomonadaceae bacterium]